MESLLDYLLTALMSHNVTEVIPHDGSGNNALTGRCWTFILEDHVCFTLDESDLGVIRRLYDSRKEWIDEIDCAHYQKIFNACV